MAGGKKKEELTLEEKLKRALVPMEEQPYKVPGNWCWTTLGNISSIISKGTTPKGGKDVYKVSGVNFLRVENFNDNGTVCLDNIMHIDEKTHETLLKRSILQDRDILISIAGSLGKTVIVKKEHLPMNTNQAVAFVRLLDIKKILPEYIRYYISSPQANQQLLRKTKVTSIPNLTLEIIANTIIPLPPLAEQQRIVEQIESLFAKLDVVKEKTQRVIDQYEEERASIIHKAYIGELTKYWHKDNNIDNNWKQIKIKEICKPLKYGTAKKSKKKGAVIVIRMGNLQNGEIVWDNLVYTDDNEDIEKYMLKKGDILFNRTNSPEWVGKTSIYRGEYPAIYAGYLIKLDYYRDKVIGDFLNYMMNSPEAKEYCNLVKTDGVNQSNINAKKIGEFKISVPSLEEQKEVVRILDEILTRQKKVLELADSVMNGIELMKKSILAKAFRGKLGTNNPEEESAIELLKEVFMDT